MLDTFYFVLYNSTCKWRENNMAVKIRLKRTGRHGLALYRIVAADSRSPRDGRILELVGTYNPNTKPATFNINEEVALKWLNNGAIATDTVRALFSKAGVLEKFHNARMGSKTETKKTSKKATKKEEK